MSAVDVFLVITTILGGLALFLFGMNTMSKSLSSMAGGGLDRMLGVMTRNRFTAFLFGAGLTALVQSSSAIAVLTVGLVNSGIIKLQQALGLLIGGALGSTTGSLTHSNNGRAFRKETDISNNGRAFRKETDIQPGTALA